MVTIGTQQRAVAALRLVGLGDDGGCGFGTPDGPCPNTPVTTVAAAAAHPGDGTARWLVRAWTPACPWHRDALAACLADEPDPATLWAARGGAASDHPAVVEPERRRLARWLEATPDGHWAAELG